MNTHDYEEQVLQAEFVPAQQGDTPMATNANYLPMHAPPPPQDWDNEMIVESEHPWRDAVTALVYVLALAAVFADVFYWRP